MAFLEPFRKNSSSTYQNILITTSPVGTWVDSTSDNESSYPSNVTRFSRALSPFATVDANTSSEEIVEQIIYYQKGVGTGTLDRVVGGATGVGVSANVRAAYGFLAHNYEPGDSIYFFGFSRGAYTARAIAGLVTACGLLTKKGMDSFQHLYNLYYKQYDGTNSGVKTDPAKEAEFIAALKKNKLLVPEARTAVEIVGVFDTVAFHQPWVSKLGIAKLLQLPHENLEFQNTEISARVKYGFHALALDETRRAFLPTLWHMPKKDSVAASEDRLQELTQVWFSGNHTDIGGGKLDHRLSDITLAWMVSKCAATGLLAFSDDYLLDDQSPPQAESVKKPWAISQGATQSDSGFFWSIIDGVTRNAPLISVSRSPLAENNTNETIHTSIADRNFGSSRTSSKDSKKYPCRSISGEYVEDAVGRRWLVGKGNESLLEVNSSEVEDSLKNRIRPAENAFLKTWGK